MADSTFDTIRPQSDIKVERRMTVVEQASYQSHLSLTKLIRSTMLCRATRAIVAFPAAVTLDASVALMAHHEWVFALLVVPFIVTLITDPEGKWMSNALHDRNGYHDACETFDNPPSVYFAAVLYVPTSFFALLHILFKLVRLAKSEEEHLISISPCSRAFMVFANFSFFVGMCAFSICFVIVPDHSTGHTIGFVINMVGRYLAHVASFVEWKSRSSHLKPKLPPFALPFMVIVGIATVICPIGWFTNYITYDSVCASANRTASTFSPHGRYDCPQYTPPIPPWFLGFWDYLWFLSLPLTPLFLPLNPVPLVTSLSVVGREEANHHEREMVGLSLLGLNVEMSDAQGIKQKRSWQKMKSQVEEMNPEKVREMREMFSLFDADHSGCICEDEIKALIQALGIEMNQNEIEKMISDNDDDGNGSLSCDEFIVMLTRTKLLHE